MSSGYGEFDVSPTGGNGTDDEHRVNYLQEYIGSLLPTIRYFPLLCAQ